MGFGLVAVILFGACAIAAVMTPDIKE